MDDYIKKIINDLSQDIINIYKINVPVNNIYDVVSLLGGRIEESVNIDSMSCVQKQNNSFVIYIFPFQSLERKKLLLHMN